MRALQGTPSQSHLPNLQAQGFPEMCGIVHETRLLNTSPCYPFLLLQ
jgi:hypothetical protein